MNLIAGFLITHKNFTITFEFAVSFYYLFRWLDSHLAPSMKNRLSAYLLSAKYENELQNLSEITFNIFNYLFGIKHFSWKCITRSIIFSTISLVLIFSFSFLYDPIGFKDFIKINTRSANVTNITIVVSVIWFFWCLIPDYISLFKTRFIISYIQPKKERLFFQIIIIIFDFVFGNIIFLFMTSLIQSSAVFIFSLWAKKIILPRITSDISSFLTSISILAIAFLLTSLAVLLKYGDLYKIIPYADLFWASMWPSVWLWSHIGLSMLTRRMIRMFPLVRRIFYLLDFEHYPFRELGVIGAVIIAATGFLVVGINSIAAIIF